jgi:predicted AlkP superfamily pyrophosphatase or phosphodiesterase
VLARFPSCGQALKEGQTSGGRWGDLRRDAVTAKLACSFLLEARPNFLFVSLGETDEHAHHGRYPEYLRALQEADQFVGSLRSILGTFQAEGTETLLMVTTDHGRSRNFNDHGRAHPESSRSFLFSEGSRVRPPKEISGESGYLRDIAPSIRAATGLPTGRSKDEGRVLAELFDGSSPGHGEQQFAVHDDSRFAL